TTAEPLAVAETLEVSRKLAAVGLPCQGVMLNRVSPPPFSTADLARLERSPGRLRCRPTLIAIARKALNRHERERRAAVMLRRLIGVPLLALAELPGRTNRELAAELARTRSAGYAELRNKREISMATNPVQSAQTKKRDPWIIRTYAGFGDARQANERFRRNLREGQRGLSIASDLPTQNGYDPDAPLAMGEIGKAGVSIAHWRDMEQLLEGIPLEQINTSMTINATAPFILALYLVVAERQGVAWSELRGTTQNDLMKEFVARGTSIFSPEVSFRLSTELISFAVKHVPNWNPINCCGYHYMESGAGPAEEIGYAFGNAMLILDALRPTVSSEAFEQTVRRISFFINSGIELVPEICKVRAYFKLWPELCREEYGIDQVAFRAGCQVRSLTLTEQQPELNIIRVAYEALPVVISDGARVNALQLPGFREALGLPDQQEQLIGLRTQQILMHETGLGDYGDIFAGSRIIEELTAATAQTARRIALELRESGFGTAINLISEQLTRLLAARHARVESGEIIHVGVNAFTGEIGLTPA